MPELTPFEIQLRNQILKNWKNYNLKRIDLGIAREKQQYDLAGKYICVEKLSSVDAAATIILNDKDNDELDLLDGVEIKTLFKKVFITNAVQADEWIDIIFGADFEYKKKIEAEEVAGGGGLPKTGQTISYQAGDDGDYEAGLDHDFVIQTIGGDGVVIDGATGLMWARDGNAAGCNNGAVITWPNGITYANGLDFAGFTDWRLPNVFEQISLINHGVNNPAAYTAFFPNFAAAPYWSSTTLLADTNYAWVVHFLYGEITWDTKTAEQRMRAVRMGV